MKKKQIVFHAVFLAVIALVWVPFAVQYLRHVDDVKNWLEALALGVLEFWWHGVLIVPVLCLLYGALAPWLHPTKRPVVRVLRSGVLLLAATWIVLDFLLLNFHFPSWLPQGDWQSLEEWAIQAFHAFERLLDADSARFSYVTVVVFSGFLHVTELYFPYPRKGKIGDIVLCIPSSIIMAAILGYLVYCEVSGGVSLTIFYLSFPLSFYVLYASIAKIARSGISFRRKIPLVLSVVFAGLNLFSPICTIFVPGFSRGFRYVFFYAVFACCFFAQWALGVLQRSLEANWEKEDREKEQAAQEQEVKAFPAEQESEALPEGREQEALPTAQEASV